MKLASKWIVVPYNSHMNKSENILTPKEKIEKIVNNNSIVDTDKLNLINQILSKNIKPVVEKSELPVIPNANDTPNFQFLNEDFQFLPENKQEKKEKVQKEKKTTKKPAKVKTSSKKDKASDLINQTFDFTQHYLPSCGYP